VKYPTDTSTKQHTRSQHALSLVRWQYSFLF